jgi:hypothetical protein
MYSPPSAWIGHQHARVFGSDSEGKRHCTTSSPPSSRFQELLNLAQQSRIRRTAPPGRETPDDGLFFAFIVANLVERDARQACGSEAHAVTLVDSWVTKLIRDRARAARWFRCWPAVRLAVREALRGIVGLRQT